MSKTNLTPDVVRALRKKAQERLRSLEAEHGDDHLTVVQTGIIETFNEDLPDSEVARSAEGKFTRLVMRDLFLALTSHLTKGKEEHDLSASECMGVLMKSHTDVIGMLISLFASYTKSRGEKITEEKLREIEVALMTRLRRMVGTLKELDDIS